MKFQYMKHFIYDFISNNICYIWQCPTTQFAHAQSLPYQSPLREMWHWPHSAVDTLTCEAGSRLKNRAFQLHYTRDHSLFIPPHLYPQRYDDYCFIIGFCVSSTMYHCLPMKGRAEHFNPETVSRDLTIN